LSKETYLTPIERFDQEVKHDMEARIRQDFKAIRNNGLEPCGLLS